MWIWQYRDVPAKNLQTLTKHSTPAFKIVAILVGSLIIFGIVNALINLL